MEDLLNELRMYADDDVEHLAVIDRVEAAMALPAICPHCELPPVLPAVCTPAIQAAIEKNIARDWALFDAGREHEAAHHLRAAAVALPATPDWVGKCPCGATVLNHGDLCSRCQQLSDLLADLTRLEAIYERDRIAQQTAPEIERIFDKWLHPQPPASESPEP